MKVRQSPLISLALVAGLCFGCQAAAIPPNSPAATSGIEGGRTAVTVYAAASLTGAFGDIGKAFQAANPGTQVVFNFAGSQELRTAIEQGAHADVFASADAANMDKLVSLGLVRGPAHVFVTNRLVVIVPRDNLAGIKDLHDLAKPNVKLDVADPSVPVGNYMLQALEKLSGDASFGADFKTRVLARVVSKENNVKQVVSKVVLGEADAGVVYATDAQAAGGSVTSLDIPDPFNVVATYPLAALKDSAQPLLADKFIAFVLSEQGQTILKQYGFAGPS
jgi:molybdate transport system substrate-binding protein